jgi:ATP synthase protein I
MPYGPDPDRLKQLDERLSALKKAQEPEPPKETHYSQAQQGWRMVTELVAGIVIGFVMGYGLDTLLGTMPVMLVIFTLLGFAAGVRTMLRTAREIQDGTAATPANQKRD